MNLAPHLLVEYSMQIFSLIYGDLAALYHALFVKY